METKSEAPNKPLSKPTWLIYYSMTGLFIILIPLSFYEELHCLLKASFGYSWLSSAYWIQLSLKLVLIVACIAAITRKNWAANLIRVSGLCLLVAGYFPVGPGILHQLIENIRYGRPAVMGGGPDFTNNVYVYSLMYLISFLLLLILVITAHIIARHESKSSASTTTIESKTIKNVRLLTTGIIIISSGLFLKWLVIRIPNQSFALMLGSYLLIAGVALLLVWQILLRNFFVVASAITMSGVLLVSGPISISPVWTLVLWAPLVILGVVSFFREKTNIKLRTISLILPLILTLIVIFVPFSIFLRFSPDEEMTSSRPENFPEYLQVPEDATNVNYRGGNNPYLSFTINDPYPATKTLDFIAGKLERAGWKKLNYDLMNPEFPSSHTKGWSPLREHYDHKYKHYTWMADWINDKDETLRLILEYRFPKDAEENLTTLYCDISQRAPKGLEFEFIENYKRFHQNNEK